MGFFCLYPVRLTGAAKSATHRWRAFQRILALAGPVAPDLANTLESDWGQWDRAQHSRLPLLDDYANFYMRTMRYRVNSLREGSNAAVHAWWVAQRRQFVVAPALTLPSVPPHALVPAGCVAAGSA